ncbi:hypothetical protein ABEB36_000179 [Hypothenemus hampei]|uniref:Uncharacterized protein n=1 Tax=Hypothenemus hampei TaxID=57062 RepID=A0ABD1FB76_HYPHA
MNLLLQMVTELSEEYDVIISSILFAKQGVIHPNVISPRELRDALLKIKLNTDLNFPISLVNYNDIHKYFSISGLYVGYNNDILIFSIKIPITSDVKYNLYNMLPLPVLDMFTSTTIKTRFALLKDLFNCKKMEEITKICRDTIIYLTAQKPVCEVLLKITQLNKIPEDCNTRTISANLEVYHKIAPNEWLFITTDPISVTLSCESNSESLTDFIFNKTGILKLQPKCKCFTMSTILQATSNMMSNFTHYIPNININIDDCCIKEKQDIHEIQMEPLRLNNINLDELRHVKHKLEMFEETLQHEINEPFFSGHHTWINLLISSKNTFWNMLVN